MKRDSESDIIKEHLSGYFIYIFVNGARLPIARVYPRSAVTPPTQTLSETVLRSAGQSPTTARALNTQDGTQAKCPITHHLPPNP